MSETSMEFVESAELEIFVRHQGDGELVLLCHGFPETSVCWQRLLGPIAAGGYHAAAIDLRGMGRSSVPTEPAEFSVLKTVDDLINVASSLGHSRFHVVGNDLGALAAWNTALTHPESVLSVSGLSLPHFRRDTMPALELVAFLTTPVETPYLLRFLEPDSHLEMEADPRGWLDACFASISGLVGPTQRLSGMVPLTGPVSGAFIEGLDPAFLTTDERDELASSYGATGFSAAMHWYRQINADFGRLEPWADSKVSTPSQFIGGLADPVRLISEGAINDLRFVATDLRQVTELPDVGHWPHLEAPDAVVDLLIRLFDAI